jgi:hypothetical protein
MDKVIIGTAANVYAEYSAGTNDPSPFVIAHFHDGELIAVEGFNSKAAALAALEEYHGADIEHLWHDLEGN